MDSTISWLSCSAGAGISHANGMPKQGEEKNAHYRDVPKTCDFLGKQGTMMALSGRLSRVVCLYRAGTENSYVGRTLIPRAFVTILRWIQLG
jgi:hypothetical protein